jgi:hypothetical protein
MSRGEEEQRNLEQAVAGERSAIVDLPLGPDFVPASPVTRAAGRRALATSVRS